MLSLFAGIDALRRALDLLGVKPIRHIAIEIDAAAARNSSELYPDVLAFRDVRDFTREACHNATAGCHIDFVLGMGGSPCQDLSGVNANRQGFATERSQLLFDMVRAWKDVLAEKLKLHYCAENVASMTADSKAFFSQLLRVMPIRVCASGISHCRRPR